MSYSGELRVCVRAINAALERLGENYYKYELCGGVDEYHYLHFHAPVLDASHVRALALQYDGNLCNGVLGGLVIVIDFDSAITCETANALAECCWDLDLKGLKTLTPEIAACLMKYERSLGLDSLQELTPDCAVVLANFQGSRLSLDGLEEVSDEVAEQLSKVPADLSLWRLNSISNKTAEHLALRAYPTYFGAFGSISVVGACTLTRSFMAAVEVWRMGSLYIPHNALTELRHISTRLYDRMSPPAIDAELIDLFCCTLDRSVLDHATCLTEEGAERIAQLGLRTPSSGDTPEYIAIVETGAILAACTRSIPLSNVRTISDRCAEILAQYRGSLEFYPDVQMSEHCYNLLARHFFRHRGLMEKVTLPEEDLAAILIQYYPHSSLNLSHFREITDSLAKTLAGHCGSLALSGLRSLTERVAVHLSSHKGDLRLNGITDISFNVARVLATHEGSLWLNGLCTLTAELAHALAQIRGTPAADRLAQLSLDGLTELTDDVAAGLAMHEGTLCLRIRAKITWTFGDFLSIINLV